MGLIFHSGIEGRMPDSCKPWHGHPAHVLLDCFSHGQDAHATVQGSMFVDLQETEMRPNRRGRDNMVADLPIPVLASKVSPFGPERFSPFLTHDK